jgi:hypothetical protein
LIVDFTLDLDWDYEEWSEYSSIKTKNYCYRGNSKDKWQDIKVLHYGTIAKASDTYTQLLIDSQKENSIAFLEYLKREISSDLPFPEYIDARKIHNSKKFLNTGYWIFFSNPKLWQIDEFLESDESISTWRIVDWQKDFFQEGQYGIIRVGKDKRTVGELAGKERLESGIYGVIQIMGKPMPMPSSGDKFWTDPEQYGDERLRVRIRYVKNLLNKPILLSELKILKYFQNEAVLLDGIQASSWSLGKEVFQKISEIADNNLDDVKYATNAELKNLSDLQKLEATYSNATPRIKEIVSQRIERGHITKEIKKINKYECQVCKALGQNPYGFKKENGEFYVETHHVVPVTRLEQGSLGTLNLLTVCPNHHRQLHYGKVFMIENNEKYFELSIDEDHIRIEKQNWRTARR